MQKQNWIEYLVNKIKNDEDQCLFATCIDEQCELVVPHSFWEILKADNFESYFQYTYFHCKLFTQNNKNIKWCPIQTCDKAIEINTFANIETVTCHCGYSFCFKCLKDSHSPV